MEHKIGNKLKELRESLGISQIKMGKIIGTTQNAVFKYENNISFPPVPILLGYADYFKVSLDWVFGRCESRKGQLYEGHNEDQESTLDGQVSALIKEGTMTYERLEKAVMKFLSKSKKENAK